MSGEEVLRLEGPGSLTVDVNESIQSDFVVIDGESEPEDLYNTSVFDSLSQADAVAQLKNLYVEKSDLHSKPTQIMIKEQQLLMVYCDTVSAMCIFSMDLNLESGI